MKSPSIRVAVAAAGSLTEPRTLPERARNWLALGLLLAAWNAADDGASRGARPGMLRGYDVVSVRAVARSTATPR